MMARLSYFYIMLISKAHCNGTEPLERYPEPTVTISSIPSRTSVSKLPSSILVSINIIWISYILAQSPKAVGKLVLLKGNNYRLSVLKRAKISVMIEAESMMLRISTVTVHMLLELYYSLHQQQSFT